MKLVRQSTIRLKFGNASGTGWQVSAIKIQVKQLWAQSLSLVAMFAAQGVIAVLCCCFAYIKLAQHACKLAQPIADCVFAQAYGNEVGFKELTMVHVLLDLDRSKMFGSPAGICNRWPALCYAKCIRESG